MKKQGTPHAKEAYAKFLVKERYEPKDVLLLEKLVEDNGMDYKVMATRLGRTYDSVCWLSGLLAHCPANKLCRSRDLSED